jgi:general secretion pathway protein B
MSSILKALRKVEDEKATLGEGSVDLAHDILKRNYDNRKTVPWALLTLLVAFVLVISGVVAWKLTGTTVSQKQEPAPSVVQIPVVEPAPVVTNSPVRKPTSVVEPNTELKVTPVKPAALDKMEPKKVAAEKSVQIPELVIEEIVYHQSPASRLAVINDLPVMEGTDIEGVRIEEIRPDSVRCSYRGIYFDKYK